MVLQLLHHVLGEIDRDGEADSRVAAGAAVDRGVNADDLALRIEERPTRIARVNRRIGLEEIVVIAAERPSLRTHDSGGHGQVEPERVADCDYPVSHLRFARITECRGRQLFLAVDFDKREVGLRVLADNLRSELPLIHQRHVDRIRMPDNVLVGENVAVGADYDARAETMLLELFRHLLTEEMAELLKRILPERAFSGTKGIAAPTLPSRTPRTRFRAPFRTLRAPPCKPRDLACPPPGH